MSKGSLEKRVAALETLRDLPDRVLAEKRLQEALRDPNNYLVSKAAALTSETGMAGLVPELLEAFDRFLPGGANPDPQCWAKTAIVKALRDLSHDDSAVYIKGIVTVQMAPVWGGSVDTAAGLRGACAMALITTRLSDLEILSRLTDCLADAEKTVRMDAAAAIGQLGREEGALLLRLKAMTGDAESEVVGQCFHSLLAILNAEAVPFVGRYLRNANEDLQLEAAIALGQSREPAALDLLKARWKERLPNDVRKGVLLALGASPLREAAEMLLQVLDEHGRAELGLIARRALSTSRFREEFKDRL